MLSAVFDPDFFWTVLSEAQAAVGQEILVLVVFSIGYTAWRNFGPRQKRSGQLKASKHLEGETTKPKQPPVQQKSLLQNKEDEAKAKTAEEQMLQLLRQNEFTKALGMFRSLERSGLQLLMSEETFASFMHSAVRVGKVDVAERMIRTMKRAGIVPSRRSWQNTLKLLSSRKQFGLCLTMYQLFECKCPLDKTVFSCLINAALELDMLERTPLMLEKFSQTNISAKDHVLHFRCYVALGDVESAEALFRRLKKEATTLMLNLLLLTCINKREPERAFRLLQEAHDLEEQSSEPIADIVSYNTVMKGFATARKRLQCFDCLRQLVEHSLHPDDITLGSLLDACAAENDATVANEIGDLVLSSGRDMSISMSSFFIKGLVRAGSLPKALALYEDMKKRGCNPPDIILYSILIKGLIDQKDLDSALALVEDMKAGGQQVDDIVLTHLLEGCRHAGNLPLGKKIYEDALASGVKPSDVTLVTLLKLHGRCGSHREAFEVVKNWERLFGTKPSVIHYTCLMSGCFRTKNYEVAWASYELMIMNGIEPDCTTLATMIPGVVASQKWERVLVLARRALRTSNTGRMPTEALNNAVTHLRANGQMQLAEELQVLMKRAGIQTAKHAAHRP